MSSCTLYRGSKCNNNISTKSFACQTGSIWIIVTHRNRKRQYCYRIRIYSIPHSLRKICNPHPPSPKNILGDSHQIKVVFDSCSWTLRMLINAETEIIFFKIQQNSKENKYVYSIPLQINIVTPKHG